MHVRHKSFFRISKSGVGCGGFAGPARAPAENFSYIRLDTPFMGDSPKMPKSRLTETLMGLITLEEFVQQFVWDVKLLGAKFLNIKLL
jgi:hypothetical protein